MSTGRWRGSCRRSCRAAAPRSSTWASASAATAVDAPWRPGDADVHTSTHGDLAREVVVSAAGFRSSLPPELAAEVPPRLALAADETLRVAGHDDLWACGDCVSFPHPRFGRLAIPHWDHALWSGRHVAASIAGLHSSRTSATPTSSATSGRCGSSRSAWQALRSSGTTRTGWSSRRRARQPGMRPSDRCAHTAGRCPQAGGRCRLTPARKRPAMPVHVIVDPDICIGSGECVALDPEAVELDQGSAHVLVDPLEQVACRADLRRLPRRRAQHRVLSGLASRADRL